MGKIKGWEKSDENAWVNEKTEWVVEIVKPTPAGYYIQVFEWGNHRDTVEYLNNTPYENKKDARKKAVNYIRGY